MENVLGEDLPVEVYKSYDKIKNLKIRVKVRKIPNACFTEKDSLTFGDTNEIEVMNLMKSSAISDEREFRWQEKIEKIDKEDGMKSKEETSKKNSLSIRLFSYIDSDILSPLWKKSIPCTYPTSQPSHLEEQMMKQKPRTRLKFLDGETWQKPLFSNVKRLVKTKSNTADPLFAVGQSMVLMAALFFEDSQTSEDIELCFLQLDDNESLIVIPDFNKRKSYTFVNSRSETFEFELENVSHTPSSAALQREKNLIKKIGLYKEKIKEDAVGIEFNKPESETTYFTLNFEIVSASNFSSSDTFVHYLIILPKGITSENNLEGVTQTCRCKVKDSTAVAYYGHTFSVDVSADIKIYNEDAVKIVFDITAVDQWGNFRNEGYGYKDIILNPGVHFFNIFTWKIEPTALQHKLQNFFIGGMPHLEDLAYVISSKEAKDSQLSKYGVHIQSSGIVAFKSHIILQRPVL